MTSDRVRAVSQIRFLRSFKVLPGPMVMALALGAAVTGDSLGDAGYDPVRGPGTDPSRTCHPETAIDTREVPNVVVSERDASSKPLRYHVIGPRTYMVFGNIAQVDEYNRGLNANAGFIVTDEGVVVIDSLGTPKLGQRLISTVRSVTDKPIRYLILTHNHPDHAYGVSAFRNLQRVKVVAHEGTLEYLTSGTLEQSVAFRRKLMPEDMKGFEVVEPDILIGGERFSKQTLELGGRTFDVFNVGSHHSHGDLVVSQVEEGIVWVSDLAFNQRVTFMGDGSSSQSVEAQDWLLETFRDARLMVPGHGSAQTPPFPMVAKTRSYIHRLRDLMGNAIEEGKDLSEAVKSAGFSDWKHIRLYLQNHRRNAHFVYTEMEQELF